ncbi:hypothetical protein [Marinibactrum halimedae]|uniref:Phasin family protein n=1 Tax=Marinibactrum halimedae TaxID=1444977 RepID=A0AA37TC52_9GAMM|nr:hypothetical protein [Marinibactrum halimedae]MCD9459251.1 hypothetical protein [Marinibactrum halimedae]GLS27325.1 hypothetical protein GCM10007877_30440 [Marinibactrum halimedae]
MNDTMMQPLESMKAMLNMQADALSKTVEAQQKAGEAFTEFFRTEASKAQSLKSPEEFLEFNVSSCQKLFELLKSQGEVFNSVAEETREAVMKMYTPASK